MSAESNLFVYGTLRFGDVRWKFLEPFVEGLGTPDSAPGRLFNTGAGYPAAVFEPVSESRQATKIVGHRYPLIPSEVERALHVLDEVESAVTGLFQRIRIVTDAGFHAWAYQYGLPVDDPALDLRPITSGDWFEFLDRPSEG